MLYEMSQGCHGDDFNPVDQPRLWSILFRHVDVLEALLEGGVGHRHDPFDVAHAPVEG